jgi:hypothetical protein
MLEIVKHITIYQVFFIGIDIYNSSFLYIYIPKHFFPTLQIEWTLILHLDVDCFAISIKSMFLACTIVILDQGINYVKSLPWFSIYISIFSHMIQQDLNLSKLEIVGHIEKSKFLMGIDI